MPALAVLRHGDDIPLGWFQPPPDLEVIEVLLHRGDGLPSPAAHDAVVVLGGLMGAYDEDEHPWLAAEKRFLADAADAGVPVLGICLGCQLLAEALGGAAFLAPGGPEIGVLAPALSAQGRVDPVVGLLDGLVPVWHQDTWEPPPGAVILAETDRYPHAFRRDGVLGIQAHPEAGPEIIARWVDAPGSPDHFERAGVESQRFLDEVRANAGRQRHLARRLFSAWLAEAGISAPRVWRR